MHPYKKIVMTDTGYFVYKTDQIISEEKIKSKFEICHYRNHFQLKMLYSNPLISNSHKAHKIRLHAHKKITKSTLLIIFGCAFNDADLDLLKKYLVNIFLS